MVDHVHCAEKQAWKDYSCVAMAKARKLKKSAGIVKQIERKCQYNRQIHNNNWFKLNFSGIA